MKRWPPKILICGHAQAGKDTAARWLAEITGLRNAGSTSLFIWPHAAERLRMNMDDAWKTRHEHRVLWGKIGDELRKDDPAALIRMGFANGDILVGPRRLKEIKKCMDDMIATHYIWIHRFNNPIDPTMTYDWKHIVRGASDRRYIATSSLADLMEGVGEYGKALLQKGATP